MLNICVDIDGCPLRSTTSASSWASSLSVHVLNPFLNLPPFIWKHLKSPNDPFLILQQKLLHDFWITESVSCLEQPVKFWEHVQNLPGLTPNHFKLVQLIMLLLTYKSLQSLTSHPRTSGLITLYTPHTDPLGKSYGPSISFLDFDKTHQDV
ncbi:hypothetical protein AMECASPLE_012210 [Ameca splendens]|uniref:Uncharacterized protein n=1 Tax=Ameca splendens TaxID=208324 RepID=A0ABV0XE29_9TELE